MMILLLLLWTCLALLAEYEIFLNILFTVRHSSVLQLLTELIISKLIISVHV